MTKYRLVQLIEGSWIVSDFSEENAVPAIEIRGFKLNEKRVGGQQLREELRGKPVFDGLAGPSWGGNDENTGEPIVRYEDWKAYDRLST